MMCAEPQLAALVSRINWITVSKFYYQNIKPINPDTMNFFLFEVVKMESV